MIIKNAARLEPGEQSSELKSILEGVDADHLRALVARLATPRHHIVDRSANRNAARWIADRLAAWGYDVTLEGKHQNVVVHPRGKPRECILVGAHVKCAHILEMVGYADHADGSQAVPPGLPISLPTRGGFLGLLANRLSARAMSEALQIARTYLPSFPVYGVEVLLGLEKFFPVLHRSDHAPFWEVGLPAVMWTDTSEFRNPHYHAESDTPETLDYIFLKQVTQVLSACVIAQSEVLS